MAASRAAAAAPTGERRDVEIDGGRVAVFESGEGEPCLLLHGYPQSHWCWRYVIGPLSRSHRVLAPDWLGWGESERSLDQAPRYEDEVSRLEHLLDRLGLARVNLFAHDYGGFLALGLAVRHPERVARLAILNSRAHATFPVRPYLMFGAMSWAARHRAASGLFERLPLHGMHRRSLRRYVENASFSEADLERYVGWMREPRGRRWLVHFFRHYRVSARADLVAALGGMSMPTAVIWGDADPYCPFRIARDLAARLPHSRLVRVPGADHYLPEERPAEVLAALRDLLAVPLSTAQRRAT